VLHRALQRAVESEVLARNVSAVISPPKVEEEEIEILTADQISHVKDKLVGHSLYDIIVLYLATGMRRGELLALRLSDVDLDLATVRIERSLEETKSGLRFKPPKTKHGKRTISLPLAPLPYCASIAASSSRPAWHWVSASQIETRYYSANWTARQRDPTN